MLKKLVNVLSFDVEDWYMSYDASQIDVAKWTELESRIAANIGVILDFLAHNNTKATFYIMGWVAQYNQETVERILAEGHEIGYHSFCHKLPAKQGPNAFEQDLTKGLQLLTTICKKKIIHYRAPRFSFGTDTAWCIPLLLKHGIEVSSSMKGMRTSNGAIIPNKPFFFEFEGLRLLEMPLNQANTMGFNWVFTGSGFFRLLPLRLIDHLYNMHDYNMAYFHPRDFDTDVPTTSLLPFYRNWMCRIGNSSTEKKLNYLFQKHEFHTVGKAAEQVLINEALMQTIRL